MKIKSLLLHFLLFTTTISAQQSALDYCSIYNVTRESQSMDSINQLLEKDDISQHEKAELLSMRAYVNLGLTKKRRKEKTGNQTQLLPAIYKDLTNAIDWSENEYERIKHTWRRHFMMEDFEKFYTDENSDVQLLKSHGYKEMKSGIGISAKYKYDGESWLGAELSLLSAYFPSYSIKDSDGSVIHKDRYSTSFSALIFGYVQNVQSQDLSDLNFSLLRIEAPLYIDLIQFGLIDTSEKNYWYYRPELGIGYSFLHLSVGYNLFFNKDEEAELSNSIFNFRIKHTF
ncbi:MAG: hypothetical protein AAGA77_15265 [Bacteroidota bacterium]